MTTWFRTLAQLLSRNREVVRRLPNRYGSRRVIVSPAASLRFWRWDLERAFPELFRWADELVTPGSVVWDVGANCGLFSFAAACRAGAAGRVVAFEPDPWLAAILRRTIAQLPRDWARIEVLEVALTDHVGDGLFAVNARSRARSHLLPREAGGWPSSLNKGATVRVSTLDEQISDRGDPDLVKIDVEGEEAQVLRGASRLMREVRPRILIEVSDPEVVGGLLRAERYVCFDADEPHLAQEEVASPTWNTFAVPCSASGEWE